MIDSSVDRQRLAANLTRDPAEVGVKVTRNFS